MTSNNYVCKSTCQYLRTPRIVARSTGTLKLRNLKDTQIYPIIIRTQVQFGETFRTKASKNSRKWTISKNLIIVSSECY